MKPEKLKKFIIKASNIVILPSTVKVTCNMHVGNKKIHTILVGKTMLYRA